MNNLFRVQNSNNYLFLFTIRIRMKAQKEWFQRELTMNKKTAITKEFIRITGNEKKNRESAIYYGKLSKHV